MNLLERWRGWFRPPQPDNEPLIEDELEDPFAEPVELPINSVFDLHTIPPRQIKAVVEEYLHQAHARGFTAVRLIHGKGRGTQREHVRAILRRTPFITEFHDAPPEAGGWGATVAYLAQARFDSEQGQCDC